MEKIGLKIAFVLALTISAIGCEWAQYPGNYRRTVLEINVDVSQIPENQRNTIDTIEITASGLLPLQTFTYDPKRTGQIVDIDQSLDQEIGPLTSSGTLFVRASVLMGDLEIAAETKKITMSANAGHEAISFTLKILPSPNGCKVYKVQRPIFDGVLAGAFDVAYRNDQYLLTYVDKAASDAKLYSVLLDRNAAVVKGPTLLDTDVSTGFSSTLPSIALDSNGGYILTWQRQNNATHQNTVLLMRLDNDGKPVQTTRRTFDAGTAIEVRPTLAISNGVVAVAWGAKPTPTSTDLVTAATFAKADLAPITGATRLSTINEKAQYISIVPRATGYAALWTSKPANASASTPAQVSFVLLDSALNRQYRRELTNITTGTSALTRLMATPLNFLGVWEDTSIVGLTDQAALATISLDGTQHSLKYNVDPNYTESTNWPYLAMGMDGGVEVYYQFRGANEGPQIFLTRITNDGNRLGAGDLQVSQNFEGEDGARYPDVVNSGETTINDGTETVDTYGLFWVEEHSGTVSRLMHAATYCRRGNYGGE